MQHYICKYNTTYMPQNLQHYNIIAHPQEINSNIKTQKISAELSLRIKLLRSYGCFFFAFSVREHRIFGREYVHGAVENLEVYLCCFAAAFSVKRPYLGFSNVSFTSEAFMYIRESPSKSRFIILWSMLNAASGLESLRTSRSSN